MADTSEESQGQGMSMLFAELLRRLNKKWEPKQTTLVYCPQCRTELCASGILLSDTDLVRYKCPNCGHLSGWDFDAPAPLLCEGRL